MQGIIVQSVEDQKWQDALDKTLRMDRQMLKGALRKAKEQGLTPIIVLEIHGRRMKAVKTSLFPLLLQVWPPS